MTMGNLRMGKRKRGGGEGGGGKRVRFREELEEVFLIKTEYSMLSGLLLLFILIFLFLFYFYFLFSLLLILLFFLTKLFLQLLFHYA